MEPLVEAVTIVLEKLRRDLRAGLEGQGVDALNWRPYAESNTIAGLVAHMLESSRYLVLTGLGHTVERDRDAQFGAVAPDAEALLARFDAGCAELIEHARCYTAADLAARRDFRGTPINGAWYLLHTCEHLQEHWGQIQLIRDLAAA